MSWDRGVQIKREDILYGADLLTSSSTFELPFSPFITIIPTAWGPKQKPFGLTAYSTAIPGDDKVVLSVLCGALTQFSICMLQRVEQKRSINKLLTVCSRREIVYNRI